MISVTIHTNKMSETVDKKWNDKEKRNDYRRYMSPYDLKCFTGYFQKEETEMIEWAMNMFNKAIGKGLKCSIRVHQIESFSPYNASLLYTHDG